jgi:flavin-dependent dehydrogenase
MSTSYAPRRTVLDKLLVDAAIAAGATLHEGFTVDQVLLEEGRVVGIRGQTQTGAPVLEQAPLVIGADGANSIVARTVAAAEYKTHDPIVLTYYAYWWDVALADGVQLEFCPQDWCAAGSSYEFTTAHGIMNAFREAQFLAEAVDDGLSGRRDLPETLADYEQRRNAAGFPYSEFTIAATTYQPVPDPEAAGALYAAIAQNSDATAGFWALFAQTMLPGEFFSEQHVRTLLQSNAGG